ncbi:kinase-like protein [Rhizopogon vinicolor AM-OR11-026]|uniref:Kinase-like protein n=1 Tax=Rhizopogon vinicolor AM-OR11-026 TaxID=1314800 RepID=A0A1B7MN84_9AGAM|nr:kinase-like protein [Rhizopogon vinicolor AM-OR11-026]
MFRNVTSVYNANLTFLEKLEEISSNPWSEVLDDLLMRWIHDLHRPYTMYCQKFTTGFDQWDLVKSNIKLPRVLEAFSEYNPPSIAAIQSSQLANPSLWTLDALFLLPKGRLLYYRKLYNNLLNNTTLSISDHRLLTVALEKLDYLLETLEVRSQVRVGDNASALSSTLPPVTSDLARKPINSPAKSRLAKSNGTHNKLFSDQFGEGNTNTFIANANNITSSHRICLVPLLDSLPFEPISRYLRDGDTPLRIGRFTDRQVDNALATDMLIFKSIVVSRAHAEIWSDNGKVYIKDTKSSCGTFLNYLRLSPAESESIPHELKDGDIVQLAVDYDDGTEVYRPVKFTIEVEHESQAVTNPFNSSSDASLSFNRSCPSDTSSSSDTSFLCNPIAYTDTLASAHSTSNHEEEKNKREEDRQNQNKLRPKENDDQRKSYASPYSESTATEEQTSQESSDASDSLQDLTNQLQGRSNYPITSGGFGDIWKCELVKLNETVQVAVKTIRAFESDNDVLMRKNSRRVRRELKVWERLKHDCILPLLGVADNFGPYPAMICPWVKNGTLTSFLERQQDTLSCQDKFSILNDIALGLQYLHSKSIVHGDLTGSNVLVHGNGRACLADFGLSTMLLEFIGSSYFTTTIRGNIRWAAAELFEVPEDQDEDEISVSLSTECDIYSFGSITLQVLTCKVPYYNVRKDNVVLGQVMKGKKPEPPKESQIAPPRWEFIQRCWLPRASRPSVGEIVAFVASERQALVS